jgi:L-2-hydroxyglutarate oxidase
MTAAADVLVVGGGIVGLATAWQLLERAPGTRVTVLDKEPEVGRHQSGRNSGVMHSGVYYAPGSAKAVNCRRGLGLMQRFCDAAGVPWTIRGKVIVAIDDAQRASLDTLAERGRANGVACQLLGPAGLADLEPEVAGVAALHVPEAAVVDYGQVCQALARGLAERGATLLLGARVAAIAAGAEQVTVETPAGAFAGRVLVNCAGLHCDRVAAMAGAPLPVRIIPFRGEYYRLGPAAAARVRGLVYPVPDPSFPFLGVHFTRHVDDVVSCGPNAVLALAREGYSWGRLSPRDLWQTLSHAGFRRLARRHLRMGLGETWRSLSKRAFVHAAERLLPGLTTADLTAHPAGVRAQAIGPDGALLDDFCFVDQARAVHVLNAPSPAATASLAIGEVVAARALARLDGGLGLSACG